MLLETPAGFEPAVDALQGHCLAIWLRGLDSGVPDENRTRLPRVAWKTCLGSQGLRTPHLNQFSHRHCKRPGASRFWAFSFYLDECRTSVVKDRRPPRLSRECKEERYGSTFFRIGMRQAFRP